MNYTYNNVNSITNPSEKFEDEEFSEESNPDWDRYIKACEENEEREWGDLASQEDFKILEKEIARARELLSDSGDLSTDFEDKKKKQPKSTQQSNTHNSITGENFSVSPYFSSRPRGEFGLTKGRISILRHGLLASSDDSQMASRLSSLAIHLTQKDQSKLSENCLKLLKGLVPEKYGDGEFRDRLLGTLKFMAAKKDSTKKPRIKYLYNWVVEAEIDFLVPQEAMFIPSKKQKIKPKEFAFVLKRLYRLILRESDGIAKIWQDAYWLEGSRYRKGKKTGLGDDYRAYTGRKLHRHKLERIISVLEEKKLIFRTETKQRSGQYGAILYRLGPASFYHEEIEHAKE